MITTSWPSTSALWPSQSLLQWSSHLPLPRQLSSLPESQLPSHSTGLLSLPLAKKRYNLSPCPCLLWDFPLWTVFKTRNETDWQDMEQLPNQGGWMRLGVRTEGWSQAHYKYFSWATSRKAEHPCLWYLSSRPFLVQFTLAAAHQSGSQKQCSFPGKGDSDSQPERQRWGAGGRNPSGSFTATTRKHGLKRFGQKEELKYTLQ